jgi:hypothetical protein
MKLILPAFGTIAAIAVAIFALSIPAFASKMNGKGYGCSEGQVCSSKHYEAATKAKTKLPKQ